MANSEEKHESVESEYEKQRERFKELKETFATYFEIEDWQGFRIILGIAAAHYLPGEMLWVRDIGASGSGKTELLIALLKSPDTTTMEAITPAAIRGGLIGGERLLDRINGKLVIMKDMAALTTTRKDIRREIFGLLRNISDGSLTSDFGTREGQITQKARFDWLLATTGIVESQRQIESLLGERFVDIQWIPGDRLKMTERAISNNARLIKIIRPKLKDEVRLLMIEAKKLAHSNPPRLEKEDRKMLAKLANDVALCRSPVQFDSRSKHLEAIPMPEVGTRLAQSFSRIVLGMKLLGTRKWQPYIERLGWDCIPTVRAKVIRELQNKPRTVKSISQKTKLPLKSVYFYLEQLELLNVVERRREKTTINESSKSVVIDLNEGQGGEVYRLKVDLPDFPIS